MLRSFGARQPLRHLTLLSSLVLAVAACDSSDSSDPNTGNAPECTAPTASLSQPDALDGSATLVLTFDRPVTGVNAAQTVVLEGGPGEVSIGAGTDVYDVTLTGLAGATDYVVRVVAAVPDAPITDADPACALALAADVSVSFTTPGPSWQHTGPITYGTVAEPTGPFFVEVSEEAGIPALGLAGGRVYLADIDGDGREDLVTLLVTVPEPVEGEPVVKMSPQVARNAGPGADGAITFEDFTEASGLAGMEMANMVFADIDNDGDQDLFSGVSFRSGTGGIVGSWLNDGAGRFTFIGQGEVASPIIGTSIFKEMAALGMADFDGDGNLDLYIGTWYAGALSGTNYAPTDDELYKGDGLGGFSPVTLPSQHNPLTSQVHPDLAGVGRAAYGLAISDYDNDGDMDIFVNNYGAGRPAANSPPRYWDHNLLWRNEGGMTFSEVGVSAGVAATTRGIGGIEDESPVVMSGFTFPGPIGGNGFGCQFGDIDNDGDMDLVVGTIAHPDYSQSDRTMLHVNQGGADPVFNEESAARGLQYYEDELHPALIDVDNDGRLDLAMSRLRGGSKWEFYLQNDEGGFEMQSYEDSGVDITRPSATVWFDYDGDGDLDFFMPKGGGRLFENTVGQDNGWLELRLTAKGPRDATGARITVETSTGTQTREITSGNGHYNSQLSRFAYFGLGGDSAAASVTIRWPGGAIQSLGAVSANQRLSIVEDGAISVLP